MIITITIPPNYIKEQLLLDGIPTKQGNNKLQSLHA